VFAWIPIIIFFFILPDVLSYGWILYGLFMLLFSYLWAASAKLALLQKASKIFNDECDPYPLEKEIQEQLSYVKSKSKRADLYVLMSAVLDSTGRHQESAELLENTDIDSYLGATPQTRFTYYNNLVSAYLRLNKTEIIPFLLHRECLLLSNIKVNEKIKRSLTETYILNLAEFHVCRKEYDTADSLIKTVVSEDTCLRQRVSVSLLTARLLIETGKPDSARPHIDFVMLSGNKLYDAALAREYWDKLPVQ